MRWKDGGRVWLKFDALTSSGKKVTSSRKRRKVDYLSGPLTEKVFTIHNIIIQQFTLFTQLQYWRIQDTIIMATQTPTIYLSCLQKLSLLRRDLRRQYVATSARASSLWLQRLAEQRPLAAGDQPLQPLRERLAQLRQRNLELCELTPSI